MATPGIALLCLYIAENWSVYLDEDDDDDDHEIIKYGREHMHNFCQ